MNVNRTVLPEFTWSHCLTLDESRALARICSRIDDAIAVARQCPASIDHNSIELVIRKLEEAEFYAFQAIRGAIDRRHLAACAHGRPFGSYCPRCAPGASNPPL